MGRMKDKFLMLFRSQFVLRHALPALLILVVAWLVGRAAGVLVRHVVRRIPRADETIERLAGSTISWVIYLFGAVAALNAFGINTTGLLAALGAIGLALALALRDTLSNVAAGIAILVLRPFAVGDFITYRNPSDDRSSGTVTRIGLFQTDLKTIEGIHVAVPNRVLLDEPIINYSRNPTRLIRLVFSISYSDSIEKGLRVLLAAGEAETRRLPDEPVQVFVDALADSSVNLSLRVWVKSEDYWPARRDLTQKVKLALEEAGLTIPFPQRVVHLKNA